MVDLYVFHGCLFGWSFSLLTSLLFPANTYPDKAFQRLLTGSIRPVLFARKAKMAQCGAQRQRGRLEVSFLNVGHLEVSIVSLNASFHLNSPRITGVVGLNGQMFHR